MRDFFNFLIGLIVVGFGAIGTLAILIIAAIIRALPVIVVIAFCVWVYATFFSGIC